MEAAAMTPTHIADRAGTLAILLIHTQIEHHDDVTQARSAAYATSLLRLQALIYQGRKVFEGLEEGIIGELESVRMAMAEYWFMHPTSGN